MFKQYVNYNWIHHLSWLFLWPFTQDPDWASHHLPHDTWRARTWGERGAVADCQSRATRPDCSVTVNCCRTAARLKGAASWRKALQSYLPASGRGDHLGPELLILSRKILNVRCSSAQTALIPDWPLAFAGTDETSPAGLWEFWQLRAQRLPSMLHFWDGVAKLLILTHSQTEKEAFDT